MTCVTVLKEKGVRLTRQRMLILEAIHNRGGHLTAEELIQQVRAIMPRVNKSTIYRTLDLLEKNGRVFKSESGDRAIYHLAEEGHHHHLVCRACGRTVECHEDLFAPVEWALATKHGFSASFNHLVINGLCRSCLIPATSSA